MPARAWYDNVGQIHLLVLDPKAAPALAAHYDVYGGMQYDLAEAPARFHETTILIAIGPRHLLLYDPNFQLRSQCE